MLYMQKLTGRFGLQKCPAPPLMQTHTDLQKSVSEGRSSFILFCDGTRPENLYFWTLSSFTDQGRDFQIIKKNKTSSTKLLHEKCRHMFKFTS